MQIVFLLRDKRRRVHDWGRKCEAAILLGQSTHPTPTGAADVSAWAIPSLVFGRFVPPRLMLAKPLHYLCDHTIGDDCIHLYERHAAQSSRLGQEIRSCHPPEDLDTPNANGSYGCFCMGYTEPRLWSLRPTAIDAGEASPILV